VRSRKRGEEREKGERSQEIETNEYSRIPFLLSIGSNSGNIPEDVDFDSTRDDY